VFGRERTSGMVWDLSPGGLSVEADRRAEQGDSVFVRLHPKGRPSIDIEAIVWNVCTMRRRKTGGLSVRLGLVLSDAPDDFLDLLKAAAPARVGQPCSPRPEPELETKPEPEPEPKPEPAHATGPPPAARRFSVRVKQSATSRTRAILVFAESAEDAEAKALLEAGAEWSSLGAASR
jgi:hypothetical protein